MLDSKETVKKKFISNSRAIIANQIGLPVGILTMNKLMTVYSREISEFGLALSNFQSAYDEISNLALGSERLHFNVESLIKQDKGLNSTLAKYRDAILIECFNLIKTLQRADQ